MGRHLFNSCICGLLKARTRVLVTHQMHFLSDSNVDHILVVQDGEIIQSGTYAELVAKGVDFHQYEYTEPASAVSPMVSMTQLVFVSTWFLSTLWTLSRLLPFARVAQH